MGTNDKTPRDPIATRRARHQRRAALLRPDSRRPYDRIRELPRVLPLWPHELEDDSPGNRRRILAKLRRALRAERRRGIAGHWTYNLCRHVELLRVYRAELAEVRRAKAGSAPDA